MKRKSIIQVEQIDDQLIGHPVVKHIVVESRKCTG